MSNKKFSGINGKGYYIALILCAAAIGISGYLYYRNTSKDDKSVEQPPAAHQQDVQAVATQPTEGTQVPVTEAPTQSSAPAKLQTVNPLAGETVAVHAMDSLSYNQTTRDWRVHDGIDIAAEAGADVCAAADGEVYSVYEDDTMGMTVVIVHAGGYATRYASLAQEVNVTAGEKVSAGQVIGAVGNTALLESAIGDHLHFAVSCNDESVDPVEFLS